MNVIANPNKRFLLPVEMTGTQGNAFENSLNFRQTHSSKVISTEGRKLLSKLNLYNFLKFNKNINR